MAAEIYLNVAVSGLLTGLVYGLMALGLSVIFGVVRVVNFAHGEMMTIAMYLAIVLFSAIGVYTVNNSAFEVLLTALFGVLGYIFLKLEMEPAPMLLGFVLGPLMEENLRRAMRISGGVPMIFIERPISLGLLIAAFILLILVALPMTKVTAIVSPSARPRPSITPPITPTRAKGSTT